jgi:hypothetical protein
MRDNAPDGTAIRALAEEITSHRLDGNAAAPCCSNTLQPSLQDVEHEEHGQRQFDEEEGRTISQRVHVDFPYAYAEVNMDDLDALSSLRPYLTENGAEQDMEELVGEERLEEHHETVYDDPHRVIIVGPGGSSSDSQPTEPTPSIAETNDGGDAEGVAKANVGGSHSPMPKFTDDGTVLSIES